METIADCGVVLECPRVVDDGDPETVIVVGTILPHLEFMQVNAGPGENAVRVPRALIIEAARKMAGN